MCNGVIKDLLCPIPNPFISDSLKNIDGFAATIINNETIKIIIEYCNFLSIIYIINI